MEDLVLLKMAVLPNLIYRFNTVLIKIPADFFCRNIQTDPKIHMEIQGTQNSQNNLEKEEQSWKNHTSQFQNLLQSYSNQN